MSRLPGALLLATGLLSAVPALAHHSYAAYETDKTVTLTGAVTTFDWANPHVVLRILTPRTGGAEPADWEVVTSEPGILRRFGWTRDSLRPGDRVLVILGPMRDGSHSGRLHTLTLLATGQVLKTKLSDK